MTEQIRQVIKETDKLEMIKIIGFFGTLIFVIGLHTSCGYLVHREDVSAWFDTETNMALSSAISFMLSGLAIFLIALRLKLNHFGSR